MNDELKKNPDFLKGCDLFNSGEYFEAHEVWEDLWVPAFGEERNFLQGLIQVAAALHHAQRSNWNGMRKLLGTGFNYLSKGKCYMTSEEFETLKDLIIEVELAGQKLVAGEEVPIPFFQLPFSNS